MELTNTSDLTDQRVVSWVDAKFYSSGIVWGTKAVKYIVLLQFNRWFNRVSIYIILIIIYYSWITHNEKGRPTQR